jgi:DNA-binding MarR family transcriptional regulator
MNEWPPDSAASRLIGAGHAVQARLEAALEPLGLSLAKFGVLANLATAGEPLPLSALAERCACVRSNITQLVDRLEAEVLVARHADPRDRRSVRAELTPEGRRRHAAGLEVLHRTEGAILAPLSPEQREVLLRLLSSLESPA